MAEDKLLTVSLLSSGRRETIERALASLLPLKEELCAEIVVVDTDESKDAAVREILERYADKIIDFKWCDDFSKARNAGLFAASGKWFFYIDDDEWLIEPGELISFIKEAEGKDRTAAWVNIIVRNYFNDELSEYSDAWVTRLIRRSEDVCFTGRVHEYFDPLTGSPKALQVLIGHTGYIFHTDEELQAHLRRNIGLLESAIADDPMELRFRHQLLQEYEAAGRTDDEKRLCEEVLGLLAGVKDARLDPMRGLFFAAELRVFRDKEDMAGERRFFEKQKNSLNRCGTIAEAYISLEAATIYYNVGEYKEARKYILRYMDSHFRHAEDDVLISVEGLYFLADTYSSRLYSLSCRMLSEIITRQMEESKDEEKSEYEMSLAKERRALYSQIMDKLALLEKAGRYKDAYRMRQQLINAMEGR